MRVLVTAALLMVLASPFPSPATRASDVRTERACRPFFGAACSEAMGRWLPRVPGRIVATTQAKSTLADAFVDGGATVSTGVLGPTIASGTLFVYGSAGPPKAHVVYDPAHRIVYYDEGCCSWHHTILAADVSPPPKAVADRDLTNVHTRSGIRLGDTATYVRSTYGPVPAEPATRIPSEMILRYRNTIAGWPGCSATNVFLFRKNRLIAIDFARAC